MIKTILVFLGLILALATILLTAYYAPKVYLVIICLLAVSILWNFARLITDE